MKKKYIIVLIGFISLSFIIILFFLLKSNIALKSMQHDIQDLIYVTSYNEKQNKESLEVITQIRAIVKNLNFDNIECSEIDVSEDTSIQIDEILKGNKKIVFLEKEIIGHLSGAYLNYNTYYNEYYDNYSIRFLKEYLYVIEKPLLSSELNEGDFGSLTVFFSTTKEDYLQIYPWHSYGLSTTAKNSKVHFMETYEGEVIEYVEYEVGNKSYIDFGLKNYTIKLKAEFNSDNSDEMRKNIFDIVRTIMFF